MRVRGTRRRRGFDRGFVLSDHADWPGLLRTIARHRRRARAGHPRLRRARSPAASREQGLDAAAARATALSSGETDGLKRFADLYAALDGTTTTNAKVAALARYFSDGAAGGRRLGGLLPHRPAAEALSSRAAARRLGAGSEAGIPDWLFEECYGTVGDFAETIALLLDGRASRGAAGAEISLSRWVDERLLPLRGRAARGAARARSTGWWRGLAARERFVWNKLITGELRVGVSQTLVVRALGRGRGPAASPRSPTA